MSKTFKLIFWTFVCYLTFCVSVSFALAQSNDNAILDNNNDGFVDTVCIPTNDTSIFECQYHDNWTFCVIDDDLDIFCIN